MYDTGALGTFTVICNHHLYLVSKHIHHPERKLLIHEKETLISHSPFLQPPATTNWLSARMSSPTLVISYKGSHIMRVPLSLLSLRIMFSGFIVLSCVSVPHSSFLLNNILVWALPHFDYPFISWRTFELFPPFVSDEWIMLLWTFTYKYLCESACMLSLFSRVQLFAILWTVAHQAPLPMGFSRQE